MVVVVAVDIAETFQGGALDIVLSSYFAFRAVVLLDTFAFVIRRDDVLPPIALLGAHHGSHVWLACWRVGNLGVDVAHPEVVVTQREAV